MALADDETMRERATTAHEFDPAEIVHGEIAEAKPSFVAAAAPIVVVILVNLVMSLDRPPARGSELPRHAGMGRRDARRRVTGVWSVIVALTCAIVVALALNVRRIPDLRATMDAGVNASALPVISVASLVGFGAVVAALPAFTMVRDAVLGIGGGPLVSLAVATNVLAALTGSASGGLTIALDALGSDVYLERAAQIGMDPALLHRVAVISSGTLDSLPHNGAVVTLLSVCGSNHAECVQGRVHRRDRRRARRAGRGGRARDDGRIVLRPGCAGMLRRGRFQRPGRRNLQLCDAAARARGVVH